VTPRSVRPSWRWMMLSATPSCAISIAWAWRSWWGAKRLRTPASAASRRSCARAAVALHVRPRVDPSMTQKSGPDGHPSAVGDPVAQVLPAPVVHAYFAAFVALAVAHEQRSAALVEV